MAEINLVPIEYRQRKERWKKVFSKTTFIILFFLVLSLLVYGGLLLYVKKLTTNLETIKKEISLLADKRTPEEENAIVAFDTRLDILKDVFKSHTYWSKIFAAFEELTIPEAFFSEAKFSLAGGEVAVTLGARTKTYTTLAQQMLVFQNDPRVSKVLVSDINLSEEGGIDFSLSLIFPAKILLVNSDTAKK